MRTHLRVLRDEHRGYTLVVADGLDSFGELIGERVVKVRCPNRRCGVVVRAGMRCGSCNRSLDGAVVLHDCVEAGHRRAD